MPFTQRFNDELAALPVSAIAEQLNAVLQAHEAAIVTAEPGAGKSTLLPLTILDCLGGDAGKIILLEPRRVAARQIASRMAWLLEERVGETVGYRIRFDTMVSSRTRIEVVTEGILTRMLLDDPALEGVFAVVFDEFHERSLASDEAFALTRQCQSLLRPDLRLVVMSATIDTASLVAALHCPVLQSQGRMFPVDIVHSNEDADAFNAPQMVAHTILHAHRSFPGDILAFLPGEAEIRRTAGLLASGFDTSGNESTHIFPLYGLLSNQEQARAIAPSPAGHRKVVLATPIAETSLTIEGVRVVVDSGLCRSMLFDSRSGLNRLQTQRISLDMATQRMGRAGRVAPGVCFRLWSAATEARMAAIRTPEIQQADLTSLLLDAAVWGERDVEALPWLTPPPRAAVSYARSLLLSLGAVAPDGTPTSHGRLLSRMPCHPRIAQMLVSAQTPVQKSLAADIAAILEEKDPLSTNAFSAECGKHHDDDVSLCTRVDALRRARGCRNPGPWARIAKIASQYADLAHANEDNAPANPFDVGALLASAYPERVGKAWRDGSATFQLAGGELVAVAPSDLLASADWIVVAAMHQKPNGVGKVFLASVVHPSDLVSFARQRDVVQWDNKSGTVVARSERRIGAILFDAKPLQGDTHKAIQQAVCNAIVRYGAALVNFSDPVQNMQRRIAFVASRHPELALPPVDNDSICQRALEWGPLFVGNASTTAELKKIDLCQVVWSLLSFEQQQSVDRMAPTHIQVPTGSRIRIEYRLGAEAPVLRVRLQECFGLVDTPKVDGAPVLMELLSPGFKPVQLTTDLRSFWQSTYFEVRKELRRRYPKHSWPDDPLAAAPVRGTKVPREKLL